MHKTRETPTVRKPAFTTTKIAAFVTGIAVTAMLVGCSVSGVQQEPDAPANIAVEPVTDPTVVIEDSSATQTSAIELLGTLEVKGRAPKTGYDRVGQFGTAWLDVDRNGCDTRNDILDRDLVDETKSGPCKVLTGILNDPYTGTDDQLRAWRRHVIARADRSRGPAARCLAEGCATAHAGATDRVRERPDESLATDGPTNASKGAGDAATWLPPQKSFRCEYVARQVSVKATYGLWVTAAEKEQIAAILADCPDQQAYTSPFAPAPVPVVAQPAPEPAPPAAAPEPAPAPAPPAVSYANCTEVRAAGAAPIYAGQPGWEDKFDRDKDGVGCE